MLGMCLVERIRTILNGSVGLQCDFSTITDVDDLYDAGMTSHSTVTLMVALEEAFGVEFPDHLLCRSTFMSVDAIARALKEIGVRQLVA
jgi:acyl carrier protein